MSEVRQFDLRTDGFTILKEVHSGASVESARRLIEDIISYAERGFEDPFVPYYLPHRADQGVLFDVLQRHPELWDLARHSRVLDAMAVEIGEDIVMYENSVVYKPKGRRNAVPYHQDFISRPNEPRKLIAWTALEPVTIETGAMKLLPGSHANGFLPWHRVPGETHHDRIRDDALPRIEPIHAVLDPGDVLIFNQLLVHGSDEVHTDSLRVALRVSYQGFESLKTPRGSPLVVRGGGPQSLALRFGRLASETPPPPFWRKVAHSLGRKLSAL